MTDLQHKRVFIFNFTMRNLAKECERPASVAFYKLSACMRFSLVRKEKMGKAPDKIYSTANALYGSIAPARNHLAMSLSDNQHGKKINPRMKNANGEIR